MVLPEEQVSQMLWVPEPPLAPHWLLLIQYLPMVIESPEVLVLSFWGMLAAQVLAWHAPLEHSPVHALPQPPQFCASIWRLTHVPLQSV
jgi:hypothetical protein